MAAFRSGFKRLYWSVAHALKTAHALPGLAYAAIYIGLRLNVLYHFFGLSAPEQFRLMPRQLWVSRRLMHQPYVVKVADIRWGGRPADGTARVTGKGLGCGLVLDGSWDIDDKRPIESYLSSYIYSHSTLQIFRDRVPYTETAQYKEMLDTVKKGQIYDWKARGCRNEDDIRSYFEKLSNTFRAIQSQGYKTQGELGSRRWFDEIKVFIDRNGEMHKQQGAGHHRLAMVRALNIDSVPVVVIGVHKYWALAAQREIGKDVITSVDMKIRQYIDCTSNRKVVWQNYSKNPPNKRRWL